MALLALGVLAAACSNGSPTPTPERVDDRLSVVTTIYPLEYFAARLGGERVKVTNLVGPGVESHSFEPTPDDIRVLTQADLVTYVGAALEPWMARALQGAGIGEANVVQAGPGLTDPHFWLDPIKMLERVELLRDALVKLDSDGEQWYTGNAVGLRLELETLDAAFMKGLAACDLRHMVTSHAAFGHLAQRYGLEQVPISGLSPEAVPGARDLADIVDTVRELGVEYILVEPLISTGFADTVALEVGVKLLPLHPLESLTLDESDRGEDYFSLMRANLASLQQALVCEP